MTTKQALDFFGGCSKLAERLGINKAAVSQWKKYPPKTRQYQIQVLSRNKLKAEAA